MPENARWQRSQIEEALRGSESNYRLLFESSRDALTTMAPPSWHFTSTNAAALKLFGVENEAELASLSPWDLSPERQPDGMLSAVKARKIIESKVMSDGALLFEWTHKRLLDGTEFPAEVLLTRIERDGQVSFKASTRDITARKQAEAKLNEQLNELRRWYEATLGQGMRNIELKREVNELLKQIGQPPRYPSAEQSNAE